MKEKETETWYIEFLNKEKNFTKEKKTFTSEDSYTQAVNWGRKNIDNFRIDMVQFQY